MAGRCKLQRMDERESCAVCRRAKWCPLCTWSVETWAFMLLRLYMGLKPIQLLIAWVNSNPHEHVYVVNGQLTEHPGPWTLWSLWIRVALEVLLLLGIRTRLILILMGIYLILPVTFVIVSQSQFLSLDLIAIIAALLLSKHNRLELVKD